jgi:hypothetical protein
MVETTLTEQKNLLDVDVEAGEGMAIRKAATCFFCVFYQFKSRVV